MAATIQQDQATLKAKAMAVYTALTMPLPTDRKSGAKSDVLSRQRIALITLEWLPVSYYTVDYRTDPPEGKAAIKRLQRALDVPADGDWGKVTNAKLKALFEKELKGKVDLSATAKGPPLPRRPNLPTDKIDPNAGPPEVAMSRAGFDWKFVLAAVVIGSIASYFVFKAGKKKGLSGCSLAGHDGDSGDEGEDGEENYPPELAEAIESVKQIPEFKPGPTPDPE